MREILFRGKRIDNGEWVEGNLAAYDLIAPNYPEDTINATGEYYGQTPYVGFVEVDTEDVSQFVGLCDKNGKKIFEGDIVKVCLNPEIDIGVVKFDERIASFIIDFNPCELGTFLDMFLAVQEVGNKVRVEVIGNVYDNPELLEVEDVRGIL